MTTWKIVAGALVAMLGSGAWPAVVLLKCEGVIRQSTDGTDESKAHQVSAVFNPDAPSIRFNGYWGCPLDVVDKADADGPLRCRSELLLRGDGAILQWSGEASDNGIESYARLSLDRITGKLAAISATVARPGSGMKWRNIATDATFSCAKSDLAF